MQRIIGLFVLLSALLTIIACSEQASEPVQNIPVETSAVVDMVNLEAKLAELKTRAQRIKDSNDIKRLQRAYGYYLDEALWDELVDLFADNATVEYAREGVYIGKERIRDYLYALGGGQAGLREGELNEHYQLMPVITLAEDGLTAKGRWRAIILNGQYGERALWGEGPYENEYVKEDGVWKISKVRWYQTIMVPYEGTWATNEDINKGIYVSDQLPPDAPSTDNFGSWPETFLPPFHFDNPVGRYVAPVAAQGEEG